MPPTISPNQLLSQLLAISSDASVSPSITLKGWAGADPNAAPSGWGFAWYPTDDPAAVVIKDPIPTGETPMTEVLRDWERFRGTSFICHIRGAARRATQEDTHPFCKSYAGRDWILAHNGDLNPADIRKLELGDNPVFEPVGHTDSERCFCWLLTHIREAKKRNIADFGYERIYGLLQHLDTLGQANIVLSDGQDLVVYRDDEGFNALCFQRRKPPHAETDMANAVLDLDLGDPLDLNRTLVIVSTQPLSRTGWMQLLPGHMIVIRRGQIVWTSHPDTDLPGAKSAVMVGESAFKPTAPNPAAPVVRPAGDSATVVIPRQTALFHLGEPGHPISHMASGTSRVSGWRTMSVFHETVYRYREPVERSSHIFRLRPVHDATQHVLDTELTVTPGNRERHFEDVFGNQTVRLELDHDYNELRILARSTVRIAPPSQLAAPYRRMTIPLVWMPWQRQMMTPYLLPPELPETQLRELSDYAMSFCARQDNDLVETLNDINTTIYRDFTYLSGSTTLETTPFDVYADRRGVCQDFANLLICLARLLNIPARYRVGYIYTGGAYSNKHQSDASHAWAELYLPWVGWRGFDPTNGCLTGLDHVRVACGRNYRDATPTSGTIFKGGAGETLNVAVRLEVQG